MWCLPLIHCRSMVNCITLNSSSRVVLASCRNAFTMVSASWIWFCVTIEHHWKRCLSHPHPYGVLKPFKGCQPQPICCAFVVFKVMSSNTIADVENQVCFGWKCHSFSCLILSILFLTYLVYKCAVPLDSIFINFYWVLLCGYILCWNQRAEVCHMFYLSMHLSGLCCLFHFVPVAWSSQLLCCDNDFNFLCVDWNKEFKEKVPQGYLGLIGSKKSYTTKLLLFMCSLD